MSNSVVYKSGLTDLTTDVAGVLPIANGGTGQSGGAWTTWTPTFTNLTVGNGTVSARHAQIRDKTYAIAVKVTLGSTSSVALNASFTIPFTLFDASLRCMGSGSITDTSAGIPYESRLYVKSATEFYFGITQVSGSYIIQRGVNSTIPITFATGDIIYVEGIIEVV